ncbi:MAG: hypothetical protein COB38_01725 [Gammaproteobacteria bacterium]|nr:MAG: hypothetical protein COB38_01725 [Gammaproteobacteria bacterium]
MEKPNESFCQLKHQVFIYISLLFISLTVHSELNEEPSVTSQILTVEERNYIATRSFTVCSVAQAAGSEASIDLVKLITTSLNMNLHATPPISWQEGLTGLKNKTCDILPWATYTIERNRRMNFTTPYARIIRVIVTRQERAYVSDISNFEDELFVTESNNQILDNLHKAYPRLKTIQSDLTATALELVLEGKAFASIASLYSVANLFNNREFGELKISGRLPPEFDDVVSLASRKNDAMLNAILEKAVRMTNPKQIANFMSQGAILKIEPEIDYQRIWIVAILIVIVFILLLWWNRRLTGLNHQLAIAHAELELLSITDTLTGSYNRLKIDRAFAQEITRCDRYNHSLSVFMIDIDHFKKVNDQHGHLIGDKVLIKFANTIKENIRSNDLLGRWGGEEFIVICTETNIKDAERVAEKLRTLIENTCFDPLQKITASFGVTQWKKGESQETLVSKVDTAMYQSQQRGRNKVSVIID